MDSTVKVININEAWVQIKCQDMGILQEIGDYFTYDFPNAKYTPKFKAGWWDGKIRFLDGRTGLIYRGFIPHIVKFCCKRNYAVTFSARRITQVDVARFIDSLQLYARGKPLEVRDYQISSVKHSIERKRAVLLSPTSSGKSMMIYSMVRWLESQGKKVLIIVPTIGLVEQMHNDFKDYSSHNKWDVDKNVHKIYSGKEKISSCMGVISTWQSIYKLGREYFEQFDAVLGDECHTFKATCLTSIMEKCINAEYRIGFTGTIGKDSLVNRLTLEGLFGEVLQVTTTKKLMDDGHVTKLKIKAILLKYPEEVCKTAKGADWQKEIDYLVTNARRNKIIAKLAVSTKGNTLVLFNYVVKQGKPLHALISSLAGDRKVHFISGGVDVTDREEIRVNLEGEEDSIVVCSYGTTSTGINIPSIENIIFASPFKSEIRNLQSIGRGLRLKAGKNACKLFDIGDDLTHGKAKKNITLNHFMSRLETYDREKFEYEVIQIKI